MQIHGRFIDDFKTERKDVAPPLPSYLRLVPILFYATIVGTVLLNALFIAQFSQAGQIRESESRKNRELQAELDAAKSERQQLESEAKRATDLANWVDTSRPLQPLIVEVARSMEPEASLVDLKLERNTDNPSQIRLSLKIQTDNTRQLDQTLQMISNSRFRLYSPQQSMDKGEVNYSATLLWQDGNREANPQVQ